MSSQKEILDRIRILRRTVHDSLANRLTYPKSVVGLARHRHLKEEEIERMNELIDEAIHLVDCKFTDFLREFEGEIKP